MQGLWKNNVSGWKKDSRRKKQTYNDFITDKGRVALKIYSGLRRRHTKQDEAIHRVENPMVLISKPYSKKNFVKETNAYRVTVNYISSYKDEEFVFKHTIKGEIVEKTYLKKVPVRTWKEIICYFDENNDSNLRYPIELKSNLPLRKVLPNSNKYGANYDIVYKQKLTKIIPLSWEKEAAYRETAHIDDQFYSKQKEFFYGKILPDWKRWTFYNDGKRRKEGQKLVNGLERAAVRNWVAKGDWDKEIKTNHYSKSIAWLID